MVQGMQSQATMVVGSATETTSGTTKSPASKYHILSKDFAFVSTKKSNPRVVAGQPFPVLPWKGMEESTAQLGILPICEGNGLGEALFRFFGSDNPVLFGTTNAYKHVFAWENLPKTATYYMSYGGGRYEKVRMCALDSITVESKVTGELAIDGVLKGADLTDSNISEYGSESLVDLSTVKQFTGLGSRLEWGEPGAAIRTGFEDVKVELKRNITMSLPGKDGQHPAGSGAPRAASSKSSDAKLTIDFWDVDGEELKRWRQGTNLVPTATAQNDSAGLVKARFSIFGPAIEGKINGEADYLNIGADGATWGGSYTGGTTVTVGELMMAALTVYEMSQGSNKDLAFRGLTSGVTVAIVAGNDVGTLTIGVVTKAITINVKTTGTTPTSTAAEILAALEASTSAMALVEVGLKNGQTGAGVPSAFSAVNLTTSGKDGFKFRYTTGLGFSDWSSWIAITKAQAQTLVSGIIVNFDDDDAAADGDYHYFCSHARETLRFNLKNLNIGVFTDKIADGVYKGHLEATHTSAAYADRPTCELINADTAAYA